MQAHLYYSEQELGTAVAAAAMLGQQVGFFCGNSIKNHLINVWMMIQWQVQKICPGFFPGTCLEFRTQQQQHSATKHPATLAGYLAS